MAARRPSRKTLSTSYSWQYPYPPWRVTASFMGAMHQSPIKSLATEGVKVIQGLALILGPGDAVHQGAGGFFENLQLGQFALDGLVFGDGAAELDAVPGVPGAFIDKIGNGAHRGRQEHASIPFHGLGGHFKAVPFLAQEIFRRDFAVGKNQLRGKGGAHAHFFSGEARP